MKIAERILKIRRGGTEIEVPVQIYAPARDATSAWSCTYEIGWPEAPRRFSSGGIDSMQALLLALQMIGAELYSSKHHDAGELVWEREGGGYGFPVPRTISDLLVGDDAVFGA
jgi:hypothetical protein